MDPEKKSLNFIVPTTYVILKSLKFSHWPSKFFILPLWWSQDSPLPSKNMFASRRWIRPSKVQIDHSILPGGGFISEDIPQNHEQEPLRLPTKKQVAGVARHESLKEFVAELDKIKTFMSDANKESNLRISPDFSRISGGSLDIQSQNPSPKTESNNLPFWGPKPWFLGNRKRNDVGPVMAPEVVSSCDFSKKPPHKKH